MTTIATKLNPSFSQFQEKKTEIKKPAFTCIACEVMFPTSERQRTHYRTDWHKYNLKRKIANLSSVTVEQFTEKVLAQQSQIKEQQEKVGIIYECLTCRKAYLTENAYNNHTASKKHMEEEQLLKSEGNQNTEDDVLENRTSQVVRTTNPTLNCLFCNHENDSLDSNLLHMTHKHSFFLPDSEYLKDSEGLIHSLSKKINEEKLCLTCNGRGKEFRTASAARAHMLATGHCNMAYDESEDPTELLKYYDFGNDLEEPVNTDSEIQNNNELVMVGGKKLGHRKFLYKKNHTKKHITNEHTDELDAEKNEPLKSYESLRRKEKRHLTITDGKEQGIRKTAEGIKEAAKTQDFSRRLAFKQNSVQTSRIRVQNPI